MGRRLFSVVFCTTLGMAALAGCTLLTDIPDDASSGEPDSGHENAPIDASQDTKVGATADGSGDVTTTPKDATTDDVKIDAPTDQPDTKQPSVVALDSVGPSSSGTGGVGKTSPLVWPHTTTGVNRALFVAVIVSNVPDTAITVDSVTYESAPFTLMKTQHSNNNTSGYVTLWVLANPPDGAHSVSVAFTGAPHAITAGSISFTGVDQQTPYQNLTAVGGDSSQPKLTVNSAPGNMVIAALSSGCTISSSAQTIGWFRNQDCNNAGSNAAQSAAPGAANVDLSYQISSDWWGLIGADVRAAGSN